ncbi:hypothetical protein LCGC14_1103310 [marine sediment metagenome]|uniref:Uncharacterized protein n=1 Tax=marine sediment metagenome TaxID=412755 RepID=A0A0F9PS27_9ZZZZ
MAKKKRKYNLSSAGRRALQTGPKKRAAARKEKKS